MSFTRILGMAMAVAFGLTANAAMAQGGYGALSYFDWQFDKSGLSDIESETVRATGGYMFNETFGIEGHVATGGTDELRFQGEDAEAELNKVRRYGISLRLVGKQITWAKVAIREVG